MRITAFSPRVRQRGVAALEAVLILPVAIALVFACVEMYQFYRAAALIDRVAFTVANGVAMQHNLYDKNQCTKSDDICVYSTMAHDLFQPLDYDSGGGLVISAYAATDPDINGNVVWKDAAEWSKAYKSASSSSSNPVSRLSDKSLFPPAKVGDTIIVAEVFYSYDPFIMTSRLWTSLGGTKELYSRFFFRPRFEELRTLL